MKATCPFCGEDWQLRRDGTLRRHLDFFADRECPGSGQAPTGHVHVCECGCVWDEEVDAMGRS